MDFFHEFLELGDIKNFGKNLGQAGTFGVLIGRLSAIPGHKPTIEISKIRDFEVFKGKFGDFVFQIHILVHNCSKMIENGFQKLL